MEGEASAVPPIFYWSLWISVFAVVAWGMMLLFSRRPWEFGTPDLPEPISEPEPAEPSPSEPSPSRPSGEPSPSEEPSPSHPSEEP